MVEEFGEDRVLTIATYGSEGTKSALATAARGLEIDNDVAMYLSGMVPNERGFDWSISDMVYGNEETERRPIRPFIEEISKHEGLLETAMSIEGIITGRGSHAAGVYIFNDRYTKNNALMKAPSGLYTTQWDMDDSDLMGGVKFDFLSIEALDKIRASMDLLIEDGYMEDQGSLKANYDHYLHPDVLDYSKDMWKPSWKGEVLDLFQFQTPVGNEAIKRGRPTDVLEGAALNSLMRLMPMEDGTVPTDKFIMMKEDIQLWYEELERAGVPEEDVPALETHYLQSFGVPNTQEEMMLLLMDERICNFSELEAFEVRAVVGRKLMDQIPGLKKKIFDRAVCSPNTIQYIWDTAIGAQMGYSFSLPHTLAYTIIALQELNIFNKYPSIYWNTACLIANSGDEDSGTDYAKIAKAIGSIQHHGVDLGMVDINRSGILFSPSVEDNEILYGMKSLSGVGIDFVHKIIDNRPYTSMEDFLERVEPNKTQMTSLIKSGAFSELTGEKRSITMMKYLKLEIPKRKRMTLANIPMLSRNDLIPDEVWEEFRVYEFNRYLRTQRADTYVLDERSLDFYGEFEFPEHLLDINDNGEPTIERSDWEKVYNKAMDPMREYLRENKDSLIETLHLSEAMAEYDRLASGTTAKWEMDSMSYYHGEHELAHVDKDLYGIVPFNSQPREGNVVRTFRAGNRDIPIYELVPIVGTVLGKNKTMGSLDLLTPEGEVILIKMNKEEFSNWDRQISETNADGSRTIIERSWFRRGNLLLVSGFRRGDQFIPKAYRNSNLQPLYLITDVSEDGELTLKSERG